MVEYEALSGLKKFKKGYACTHCREIAKMVYVFELHENENTSKVYCRCGSCGHLVIVKETKIPVTDEEAIDELDKELEEQ